MLNDLRSSPRPLPFPPSRRAAALALSPPGVAGALALGSAAAALSWFRAGRLIATGDNFPAAFLAPDRILERAGTIWGYTSTSTGGIDNSATLQALPAAFAKALEAAGASPAVAQAAFLTLLFATIAPAMFLLLRTLLPRLEHLPGAAAGAFFYAFNPIVFFAVPNMVLLLGLSLLPLLVALAIRGVRVPGWRYPAALAAASLALSHVLLNPPTLVLVCGAALLALVVASARAGRRRNGVRLLVRTLALVAVVDLWWLVPSILFYAHHPAVTPTADPFSWSWTQARSSIVNVLRLVPGWSWPQREYFPYAPTLERPPFVALSLVPAAATLAAAVASRRPERRIALCTVAALGVAALLAKGLHAPLGAVNEALDALPGMWLYREPATKFGVVVAGTLALGIALFVTSVPTRRGRIATAVAFAAAAAGVAFPLWTGKVVPDSRPLLPPEHVAVPAYWSALARVVALAPGRTLVLPPDDYYQMPYTWGFYGDDALPQTLIGSSVIVPPAPSPQAVYGFGYFQPDEGSGEMVAGLRRALAAGRSADLSRFARVLGIRWVVVRHDIDAAFPGRTITSPAALSAELMRSRAVRPVARFGALDLFEIRGAQPPVWTASSALALPRGAPAGAALALGPAFTGGVAGLPTTRVTTLPFPAHGGALPLPGGASRVAVDWPRGLAATLVLRAGSVAVDLPRLTIEGRAMAPAGSGAVIPLGGRTATGFFAVDGRLVRPGPDGRAQLVLGAGPHRLGAYASAERTVIADGSFETGTWRLGDCHTSALPPRDVRLRAEARRGGVDGRFALLLSARRDSACAFTPLRSVDPASVYRISLAYRSVRGAAPRLCVWQEEPRRCAPLAPLAGGHRWRRTTQLFRLDPGTRHAVLFLYADAPTSPTAVLYDAVRVERFAPRRAATFTVGPIGSWQAARVPMTVRTPLRLELDPRGAALAPTRVEGAWSGLGDCNAADARTPAQVGLRSTPVADGVVLQARAHSACVHAAVSAFDPAAAYRLSLDYRVLRGLPARLCVWESGVDRCAPLPPLAAAGGPHRYSAVFRPDSGATSLDVYVYADGSAGGTEVLYRRLQVSRLAAAPSVAAAGTAPAAPRPPRVSIVGRAGTEYRLQVDGAAARYLLVLGETYDRGWQLSGAPGARHIRVNGYANGWIVDRRGSYPLAIRYGPQRVVDVAQRVSLAGSAALLVAAAALLALRRRRT